MKGVSGIFSPSMKGSSSEPSQVMSDLLSRPDRRLDAPFPASRRKRSFKPGFVVFLGFVIVLALGSGALLLFTDLPWPVFHLLAHAPASAIPLLFIGVASLGFQFVVCSKRLDLLKASIVSAAFLFWGIDQLLPTGGIATTLGDVVIALYVLDLGWMMLDRLIQQGWQQQQRGFQETNSASPLTEDLSDRSTQPLHILPIPPLLFPSVPGQTTRSASTLKRNRLLPLPKTPQERQPSAEHT
jgi:hypothetical protein